MLALLASGQDLYTRDNAVCHLTASAWVTTPTRDRVLMCYHDLYDSWSWLGGHADGQRDLAAVALREVREESGLASVRLARPGLLSVEVLCVDGHEKRGAYVSSHLHLNVTYLLQADDAQPLRVKPDENSAVAWLPLDQAADNRDEPFMAVVYRKLNDKLKFAKQISICPRVQS
jgi:ADP-ribose pyrophosphatase YjhB (NUDIX family)